MWPSGQSASSASPRIFTSAHPRESPALPSKPGYEPSLPFSVHLPLDFSFLGSVFILKTLILQEDFLPGVVAKGAGYTNMQIAAKQSGQKKAFVAIFSFFCKSAKKLRKNCNKREWLWPLCIKSRCLR